MTAKQTRLAMSNVRETTIILLNASGCFGPFAGSELFLTDLAMVPQLMDSVDMEVFHNEAEGIARPDVNPTAGKENKNANSAGRKSSKEGKKGVAGAAAVAFGAAAAKKGSATPAPAVPKKATAAAAAFGSAKKKIPMTPAEKKRAAEEQAVKNAESGALKVSATVKMSTRLLARRRALSQVEMQVRP